MTDGWCRGWPTREYGRGETLKCRGFFSSFRGVNGFFNQFADQKKLGYQFGLCPVTISLSHCIYIFFFFSPFFFRLIVVSVTNQIN